MKVEGNGQGKILTAVHLRLLFTDGLVTPRDRALFGICLYTGCRVIEALALQTTDMKSGTITFRKSTTKGKLKTRVVDIQAGLAELLADYQPRTEPCLVGVSTHSFRRTALTMMSSAGVPLRHIQEISGHNDLGTLQRYLEVTPEQRKKAVSVIAF